MVQHTGQVAGRHGCHRIGRVVGVGRFVPEADVADQIHGRHNVETLVPGNSILPLVVPHVGRLGQGQHPSHFAQAVAPFERPTEGIVELARCYHFVKVGEVIIVELPGAAPGCPAPAVALRREVVRRRIRGRGMPGFATKVVAADVHHAPIVAVAGQQLGAKPKKAGCRYAVIFEDNALCFLRKKPVQGRNRPQPTVQVFFLKQREHFTGPVYILRHCPGLGAAPGIGWVAGAGAIGRHVQTGRPRLPDGLKHAPGSVGTPKN